MCSTCRDGVAGYFHSRLCLDGPRQKKLRWMSRNGIPWSGEDSVTWDEAQP